MRNGIRTTVVIPESYEDAIQQLVDRKWALSKSDFIRTCVYNELKLWFGALKKDE